MPTENESYPECIQCGYVLAHLREPRCPECGAVYDESYLQQTGQYRRRQRRRRTAFITIATLLALVVIGATQRATLRTWAGRAAAWLHTDAALVAALIEDGDSTFLRSEFYRRIDQRPLSRTGEARLLSYLHEHCTPRIEPYSFDPTTRTLRFAVIEWSATGGATPPYRHLVPGIPLPDVRVSPSEVAGELKREIISPGLVKVGPVQLFGYVACYEVTLEEDPEEFEIVAFRDSPRQLLWWPDSPKGTLVNEVRRTLKRGELTALPRHIPLDKTEPVDASEPPIRPPREMLRQLLLGE